MDAGIREFSPAQKAGRWSSRGHREYSVLIQLSETGLKGISSKRRSQEVSSNKDKQADYEVRDKDFQIILKVGAARRSAQAYR